MTLSDWTAVGCIVFLVACTVAAVGDNLGWWRRVKQAWQRRGLEPSDCPCGYRAGTRPTQIGCGAAACPNRPRRGEYAPRPRTGGRRPRTGGRRPTLPPRGWMAPRRGGYMPQGDVDHPRPPKGGGGVAR